MPVNYTLQDPNILDNIIKGRAAYEQSRQSNLDYNNQQAERAGRLAFGVLNAPPQQKAAVYAANLQKAKAEGMPGVENMPETYSPDLDASLMSQAARAREFEKATSEKWQGGQNAMERQVRMNLGSAYNQGMGTGLAQQQLAEQQAAINAPIQAQILQSAANAPDKRSWLSKLGGHYLGLSTATGDASKAALIASGMDQKVVDDMSASEADELAQKKAIAAQAQGSSAKDVIAARRPGTAQFNKALAFNGVNTQNLLGNAPPSQHSSLWK